MINVEGRIREDRMAKKTVSDSRAKVNHLTFSERGIVGDDNIDGTNPGSDAHGKKRIDSKPTSAHQDRGKKVVTDEELHVRFAAHHRKHGKHIGNPSKSKDDGLEKPVGPPPGANLTSRQRAEKILREAVTADPALDSAVQGCIQQKGPDMGVFEAVKIVQRHEAAKNVQSRNTTAAHLRSDDEPSHLAAPFAQKTTQRIDVEQQKFHKRMLENPPEPEARPEGIRRVAQEDRDTPFDTKVARFYPDPPQFGKGREIWSAQGKKRCDVKVAEHDLDELAKLKAHARCGGKTASEKQFPQFVLGEPTPARLLGKNSSPEKNMSQIKLGNGYGPAAGLPKDKALVSEPASQARDASSQPPQGVINTRNAFAHKKNASSALW